MFCIKCGKKISQNNKFCQHCGEGVFNDEGRDSRKLCPFCKFEIPPESEQCPHCKRTIVEKVPRRENASEANDIPRANSEVRQKKTSSRISRLIHRINLKKLLLNKYVAVILGIAIFIWALSGIDTSSNSGGTKAPLPTPNTQPSGDVVEIDTSAPAFSLDNGTILKKNNSYLSGYGELKIENGTSLDAVAKLVRDGTSVLTVYIKANNTYTIADISDGVYWLAFTQGVDWDSDSQNFKRNVQYSAIEDTFNFITFTLEYTIFEVTLNPVVGGTAETADVDPQQFNAY